MKKVFAGVAGTMLLGASMVVAQEPAQPKAPELVKNTASATATDAGFNFSLTHSTCMADARAVTVSVNGGLSMTKPVTADQAASLQKAWETTVEPVLDADIDPFLRSMTKAELEGLIAGDIGHANPAASMSDEELSAHAQKIQLALGMFQMQVNQIFDGNQPDGMGISLGAGYSISKAPVAACTLQPTAPASAPK